MKLNTGELIKKAQRILERLSSEPEFGGMVITDLSLQHVRTVKGAFENVSVRLPEGVVKEGIVKDQAKLLEALEELHGLIMPQRRRQPIKVVVSLPAALVYTQSLRVPFLDDERLKESAALNLQIISPIAAEKAYMSWQKIGEVEDQIEILGAFAEKAAVDGYKILIEKAGFTPVTFEFPGLGLARAINEAKSETRGAVLAVNLSNDGMNFIITREGALHFDYFLSWAKLQEGRAAPLGKEAFGAMFLDEVRKVANFSLSRFREGIREVLFIAPGMEAEIKALLDSTGVPSAPLRLNYSLAPDWYAAIGTAIRGREDRGKTQIISLGTEGSALIFFEERAIAFIILWRNVTAAVLALFLAMYAFAAGFIVTQAKNVEANLGTFRTENLQKELDALEIKAREFNENVAKTKRMLGANFEWSAFLGSFQSLAAGQGVAIASLEMNAGDKNASLAASAASHEAVLRFKNTLAADPRFGNVDLPLSRIVAESDTKVSFSMSFQVREETSPP